MLGVFVFCFCCSFFFLNTNDTNAGCGLAIFFPRLSEINLQCRANCLSGIDRYVNILLDGTTAHTDCTNEITLVVVNRLSTGENHQTVIRGLKAPEIVTGARLRAVVKAVRWELAIEKNNSLRLLLGHVDAAVVGVIHVDKSDQVSGGVEDRDVFEYANNMLVR